VLSMNWSTVPMVGRELIELVDRHNAGRLSYVRPMDDRDDVLQNLHAQGELTRRGLLRAGVGGGAGVAAILALPAAAASAPAASVPAGLAAAHGRGRVLRFTAGTNSAVTASPAGDRLVIEVQGVLWALPRRGGRATALTTPALEPTRPAWSPAGELHREPAGARHPPARAVARRQVRRVRRAART
jgi:hypothetical protein